MTLAGQLRRWIMKRAGGNGQDPGFQPMMDVLLRAQPDQYRRATDEALLILRWIRQFAAAL
jgi:CRISPR-associated protein Cmr5